jgi:hypothetical protein
MEACTVAIGCGWHQHRHCCPALLLQCLLLQQQLLLGVLL